VPVWGVYTRLVGVHTRVDPYQNHDPVDVVGHDYEYVGLHVGKFRRDFIPPSLDHVPHLLGIE
jgi:hypothetical protein